MSVEIDHDERATEVQEELARILGSTEFLASAQLTHFLDFIVQETLAGREERLKERKIARDALDRGADFDPRLDCVVRVVAGRLRRALERYYAKEGATHAIQIEVPKGGYRPVFRRLDSAAEVNKRPANTVQMASPAASRICPMGYPVVAVMPFVTFTRGESERFVADCIAEDISVRLSNRSWLQVVGFLVTRSIPIKSSIPNEIGAGLHVDYSLTGSVRRRNTAGFRITVELVRTCDAVTIWAGEYDVSDPDDERDELESVVHRVAVAVGDMFGALSGAIWSAARRKPVEGITAVEAILRQMHYQATFAPEIYADTHRAVERAVRDNPDFAWGWGALAALHVDDLGLLANGGAADAAENVRACLHRGMLADPTCAYVHWIEAVNYLFHGRNEEAIDAAQRTLDFAMGSPSEVGAVGTLLNVVGEVQQGQALTSQALRINPRLPGWIHWGTTLAQLARGDYEAAIETTERFCMPQCFWDPILRAMALAGAGTMDQGLVERAIRLRPELAERARELGGRIIKNPELLDLFVDCVHATDP